MTSCLPRKLRSGVDSDGLLDANARFYEAFEHRDLGAMRTLWADSDDSICVHPGWTPIYGKENIAASWYALLSNGEQLHFMVADARTIIAGETGTVTCIEEMIDGKQTGRAFAMNTFVRSGDAWRLLVHVATPILR